MIELVKDHSATADIVIDSTYGSSMDAETIAGERLLRNIYIYRGKHIYIYRGKVTEKNVYIIYYIYPVCKFSK